MFAFVLSIGLVITEKRFQHAAGKIGANPVEINLIISCISSFANEIGHSPDEVGAVTGLPYSLLESLLARLALLGG
jgi:hypothetical protein